MSEVRIPVLFLKERPIPGRFVGETKAEFDIFHNYIFDYQVEMYWPPEDRMVPVGFHTPVIMAGVTIVIDMEPQSGGYPLNGNNVDWAL